MRIRGFFRQVANIFRVQYDQPDLIRAQVSALSRQIPLMYFLLTANALALSYTHYGAASDTMTIVIPAILSVVFFCRAIVWIKAGDRVEDLAADIMQLRRIRLVALIISVISSVWAVNLFSYGDPYQQGHVAYSMSITVVGCILCMLHFPPAAFIVVGIVLGTFVVHFGLTGNDVFMAIAANMALVSVVIVQIIRSYYAAFSELIASRRVLEEQHRTTQELSNQNRQLAHLDFLTGLANRRDFFHRLETMLAGADDATRFAVAVIDLDGFKPVNDVHGHMVGDDVLVQAGQRLVSLSGGNSYFARLGGDEFGLIVDHYGNEADLTLLGRALCDVIKVPFETAGGPVHLSCSVGFATYPAVARTPTGLFERADFALYHAKKNNPGSPVLFAARHESLIRQESGIEQALRRADLDAELSLNFQPIFNLLDGTVLVNEALARWHSPVLGRVAPDVFFPLAEKTGQIGDLTRVLFEKLLVAMATWPDTERAAFNLSAQDITSLERTEWLLERIHDHGLAPHRITFEITETALLRDFDAARQSIETLRQSGARVALDDFGIGYSSLRLVHELEFDSLKIDRSFTAPIARNPRSQRIVKTMFDMCDTMGIRCVVEGVETAEQRDILMQFGCRYAQGYFFAYPAVQPVFDNLTTLSSRRTTIAHGL
ncbi:MAG: EAL domain-containing protein [Pseudomonadota bacterium]